MTRAQRVGRGTVAKIRRIAVERGWLDAASPMPDDATLAEYCKASGKNPQNISTVEPFREEVLAWHAQRIQVSTMRQALARKHGFAGSAHSLYRFLGREAPATPAATVILEFAAGEQWKAFHYSPGGFPMHAPSTTKAASCIDSASKT